MRGVCNCQLPPKCHRLKIWSHEIRCIEGPKRCWSLTDPTGATREAKGRQRGARDNPADRESTYVNILISIAPEALEYLPLNASQPSATTIVGIRRPPLYVVSM